MLETTFVFVQLIQVKQEDYIKSFYAIW